MVRWAGCWRLKLLITAVLAVGAGVVAWWVCQVLWHWQSSGDVVAAVIGTVTFVGAVGVVWVQLSAGAGPGKEQITVADTGVYTEGKIGRNVHTKATGVPRHSTVEGAPESDVAVGRGAVFARDDIGGDVTTGVSFSGEPTRGRSEREQDKGLPPGPPSPPRPSPAYRSEPPDTR